jgi:hypothetical protein
MQNYSVDTFFMPKKINFETEISRVSKNDNKIIAELVNSTESFERPNSEILKNVHINNLLNIKKVLLLLLFLFFC